MTYAVTVVFLIAAGAWAALHWSYYPLLGLAALHLVWQARALKIDTPDDCLAKFRANHRTGALVFLAIVVGSVLA